MAALQPTTTLQTQYDGHEYGRQGGSHFASTAEVLPLAAVGPGSVHNRQFLGLVGVFSPLRCARHHYSAAGTGTATP